MTGVRGVIYTNFNPTKCRKKCNFFHFFDTLNKSTFSRFFIKAEINEESWEALYRTESLPFAKPESGKITVKVINHYGDEAMKEYKV
ncbi:hypothetical protein C6497_13505 [Candidatus Poribacteria bacterium]|nr:MAG: hypothetical protein C6497_13505 [Candidatus Poribacteria bacterium]